MSEHSALLAGVVAAVTVCAAPLGASAQDHAGSPKAPAAPAQPQKTSPDDKKTPPDPNQSPKPTTPEKTAADDIKSADDLLTRLETADKDITTVTADLQQVNVAGGLEAGDREVRQGTLTYSDKRNRSDPKDTSRSVNVHYQKLLRGREQRDENITWIVSSGTIVEQLERDKHVNRYKLAPGNLDPFKVGEGPFPIPFGQKKDDILARFDVELLPGGDGLPKAAAAQPRFADACQLRLVPKAGTQTAKSVKEVRFWFGGKPLLPVMARTVNIDGSSDEYLLLNVKLNEKVDDKVFDTKVPDGWTVDDKQMQ